MIIQIQAKAMAITPEDIAAAIPADVFSTIKKTDPKPFFQAYSIVQEGRSAPRVIGEGNQSLIWPRRVVEAVQGAIKRGLQFFIGHEATNSTVGRPSVGEVVGSITRVIGGALHQIAIGYFPPETRARARDLDICSIEADVFMSPAGPDLVADSITCLSGIALGNSRTDHPAFPGAVRLGALQAFGPEDPPPAGEKPKLPEDTRMTFDDVKKAAKDMNIHPGQIFSLDDLKADRVFGPLISEGEAHKKTIKDLQDEIQKRDDRISTYKKAEISKGAADRLSKFLPEGLTEKQKTFLTGKFNPEKMDEAALTDDGLKKFVDSGMKEYADMAKLFMDTPPANGGNGSGGAANQDGGGSNLDEGSPVDQIVNAIKTT